MRSSLFESSRAPCRGEQLETIVNKNKVIRADLLDFAFDLDFYFEDIFRFGNISVLVTLQF